MKMQVYANIHFIQNKKVDICKVAVTDLSALLYVSSIVVSLFLPCSNHHLLHGFLLVSFASPIGACTAKVGMLTLGSASG